MGWPQLVLLLLFCLSVILSLCSSLMMIAKHDNAFVVFGLAQLSWVALTGWYLFGPMFM